ncbi:glutaminyl-peptide cyclotransferase-like isoform X2 [Anopheles cruzii]|uniref:glutaminyl-peptide cyclotransferase-like isoform X2 n=1 Tax=Anopheles cruzii TaxID=68878 RepID=UPI0022EC872F|nr:glutaminyl-peptide cyclotransferase-like isoform X2 [Anopheles cruzii]
MPRVHTLLYLLVIALIASHSHAQKNVQRHAPSQLSVDGLHRLAEAPMSSLDEALSKLLVERVVGTDSHEGVKNFLIDHMRQLSWTVEVDEFEDTVPIFGKLQFSNVIATLNPNAQRNLVLACHYDSKYFPNQGFIGATDSAVPCAMMLTIASSMSPYLAAVRENADVGLQFIFFDGEEAFERWTATDSIYGARHLAARWEQEDRLKTMDMLVLLDLLDMPEPKFYSYFPETEKWYVQLISAEKRLDEVSHLENYSTSSVSPKQQTIAYFQPHSFSAGIEDDHIPFLRRGVPVLHIIPSPFPDVWHQPTDNADIVDLPTVRNLVRVFRVFIAEYLHLPL